MTEDEAKTKWCPFARVGYANGDISSATPNRLTEGSTTDCLNGANLCIASGCMAWRSRHQWFDNAQQEPEWVSYAPYAFEPGEGQERDDGYCGLAGAPQ